MSGPLWPKPIPVIGLTGEYASGKTLFALTIAPGRRTRVYDLEKSSASYEDLGCDRIDVPDKMLEITNGKGASPEQTFLWWRDHVRTIEPGQFDVIVLDPVSEIEQGLYDFVSNNPGLFNKTKAQYLKSSAMIWGDVKDYWKRILSELAARCQTFAFIAHLKSVWVDNKPTNKKAPKGKSTLEELASLYLWMERKPNARGEVPAVPSAVVKKGRLLHTRIDPETGEIRMVPALPPRLPVATPAAIRRYMLTPPDPEKLKPEELAPEEKLSEEDMLELRARVAEAEVERLRLEAEASGKPTPKPAREAPQANGQAKQKGEPSAAQPTEQPPGKATEEHLARLAELRDALFARTEPDDPKAVWSGILKKRHVVSARDLTQEQADALIKALEHQCSILDLEEAHATNGFRPS